MDEIERIYKELDHALGGEIEPSEDMSLPEAIQYLVNQRERLDFIIKQLKHAHLLSSHESPQARNVSGGTIIREKDGGKNYEAVDGETSEKEEKDCEN
jgi:predicted transcriptional regulator